MGIKTAKKQPGCMKHPGCNGINQFTFWGELVFSLPKSANNPFSKGLAF